jgi:hypothetical protein
MSATEGGVVVYRFISTTWSLRRHTATYNSFLKLALYSHPQYSVSQLVFSLINSSKMPSFNAIKVTKRHAESGNSSVDAVKKSRHLKELDLDDDSEGMDEDNDVDGYMDEDDEDDEYTDEDGGNIPCDENDIDISAERDWVFKPDYNAFEGEELVDSQRIEAKIPVQSKRKDQNKRIRIPKVLLVRLDDQCGKAAPTLSIPAHVELRRIGC